MSTERSTRGSVAASQHPATGGLEPDGTGSTAGGPTQGVTDVSRLVRLATMAKMLLLEANAIELDAAARHRLAALHDRSVTEVSALLSGDLREEFTDLQPLFPEGVSPTAAEVRVAHAQLVGWLEGLFQGLRISLMTRQLASQDELARLYSEALREAQQEQEQEQERRRPYL